MRNQAFESRGMAQKPVDHVSAITRPQSAFPLLVHKWIGFFHVVQPPHQVYERLPSPIAIDAINEGLPVACGATRIDHHHQIAIRRQQLSVPAIAPFVTPRTLWTTVDQELHRILLAGIESRRLHQEAFHLRAFGPCKPEWFQRLHRHLRQHSVIQMAELFRLVRSECQLIDFVRRLNGHAGEGQGLAIRRENQIVVRAARDFTWRRCRASRPYFQTVNRYLAFVLGSEVNRCRIGRPRDSLHPVVPTFCEIVNLTALAVIYDQSKAITFIACSLLHPPCEVSAIRGIEWGRVAARTSAQLLRRASGDRDNENLIVCARRFYFIHIAGERDLPAIGRDGVHVLPSQAERRNVMISRRNVLRHAAGNRNHKQMASLESGVAGPMAVKQPGKDHGLYFRRTALFIAGLIAGVVGAVRIDLGDKQDALAIGRPDFSICLSRNVCDFMGITRGLAAGGVKVHYPNLRAAIVTADKEDLLAIRRPPPAVFTLIAKSELPRFSSRQRKYP